MQPKYSLVRVTWYTLVCALDRKYKCNLLYRYSYVLFLNIKFGILEIQWSSRSVISSCRALTEPDKCAIYCVYINHLLLGSPQNLSAVFTKWRGRRTLKGRSTNHLWLKCLHMLDSGVCLGVGAVLGSIWFIPEILWNLNWWYLQF